jgi:hypothetical protein
VVITRLMQRFGAVRHDNDVVSLHPIMFLDVGSYQSPSVSGCPLVLDFVFVAGLGWGHIVALEIVSSLMHNLA